ncbi:MAG: HAD-IA family hydrolase [Clostridia bacterium]|nr:HAD-IA family hydrolase [Clostridia bacterium]
MGVSVLFDMDGVLVDSEPVINAAAIMGLAEYGVHAVHEDFLPFVGAGEDKYIGGVAEKYGVTYQVEMKHRVYQIYLDIVPERIKVFDGIHDLLESLNKNGFGVALASSADLIKIDANLKAAKISREFFQAVVGGEDVINKKPSPDIYLTAAKRLGEETKDCIVVEDAINGIMAAKAAGMRCIAVTTSFPREVLIEVKPDYVCDSIPEVKEILMSLK